MSTIEGDIPVDNGKISNKRPKPKRTSEVWNYFHDLPDNERAICKSCGKSLSAKTSTGTSHLKRHMESCLNLPEKGMNQTPFIDWQVEEILTCNIVEEPESGDASTSNKKQKRSEVWDHFKKTPDRKRAICGHCGRSFSSARGSGTSHLKRHLEKCDKQPIRDIKPTPVLTFDDEYENFGVNQEQNEEPHLNMDLKIAVMAEIPLLSSDCKRVWHSLMGPINLESEVCDYYQNEQKKLCLQLKNLTSRVTITCEMSRKVAGYISVTVYFIDDDFSLVQRLIGFKKCASGIVAAIESCISDWKLEDNIFAFTLDPGFNQANMIDSLRAKYSSRMLFDGQYIHVPCCKTTLVDFIDHSFYSFVLEEGQKIKEFFESLTSIPSRLSAFNKLAVEMGNPPVDVIWLERYAEDLDSVVRLLKDVILYKDVFSQYILTEIGQWHFTPENPCCVNWKRVELALQLIGPICDIVNGWSGCQYLTPNLYFQSLLEIKAIISGLEKDISEFEVARESENREKDVFRMKDAISDHLGTCNELLFIACVLDPRFKLVYLEYCFEKILESNRVKLKIYRIRECIRMFFDEYSQGKTDKSLPLSNETTNIKQECSSSNSAVMCRTTIINDFSLYKKQVKMNTRQSELDEYLSEDVVDVGDADFDLLGWWKQNNLRYPVLSRIARDVLVIPTFCSNIDAEQEVDPRLVEAVMCVKTWIISGA